VKNHISEHKNIIASTFDKASKKYGRIGSDFFAWFGRRIADYAELEEGSTVLDIACGRGASLFPAKEKIGSSGKVTGIDISEEMIKNTRRDAERLALKNVKLKVMDAENLDFPAGCFDAVLCGFSLFFLPQLDTALNEVYRVLKTDGRFVTSTFGERDDDWRDVRRLIGSYQKKIEAPPLTDTQLLNKADNIKEQFEKAGFKTVEIFTEEKKFYYKDVNEWWQVMWSSGCRGFLEMMDETVLAEFKEKSFKIIEGIEKDEQGIPEIFNVLITKAVKTE